jgi:hypothetical protein
VSPVTTPGRKTSEYQVTVLSMLVPAVLSLAAMGLLAVKAVSFDQLLALLAVLSGPSMAQAYSASKYTTMRTEVKARDVTRSRTP